MRKYVDLNLNKELFLKVSPSKIALELKNSGFSSIAVSSDPNTRPKEINAIKENLENFGIDVAPRVDLKPQSRAELLRLLRKNRSRFEIVSIKPVNKELAVTSARDRRVDTIYYELTNRRLQFRESTAHVCTSILEIQLRPLIQLSLRGSIHTIMSRIINEVKIALKHGVPIVITSSAKEIEDIKAAKDMAAFSKCLGLKDEDSLDTVSEIPMRIISRNRIKLSEGYMMEGVELYEGE